MPYTTGILITPRLRKFKQIKRARDHPKTGCARVLIAFLVTEIKEAQAVFRGSILHENAKFYKS